MIRASASVFLLLTVFTGVVYPAVVTLVAQVAFPYRANGSLVVVGGRVVGSELVGQAFDDERYFWSRPSATAPAAHGAASLGSNFGPTNPALVDAVRARVEALHASDPTNRAPIPVDLVTTSASGLDPDLSPEAIDWQVPRVARVRGIPEDELRSLVRDHTLDRTFGVLGEPRVNVLALNLALDARSSIAAAE